MDPQLLANVRAAIEPPSRAAPAQAPPAESQDPNAPKRRGRPPKKPDAAYLAARAAITGEQTPAL